MLMTLAVSVFGLCFWWRLFCRRSGQMLKVLMNLMCQDHVHLVIGLHQWSRTLETLHHHRHLCSAIYPLDFPSKAANLNLSVFSQKGRPCQWRGPCAKRMLPSWAFKAGLGNGFVLWQTCSKQPLRRLMQQLFCKGLPKRPVKSEAEMLSFRVKRNVSCVPVMLHWGIVKPEACASRGDKHIKHVWRSWKKIADCIFFAALIGMCRSFGRIWDGMFLWLDLEHNKSIKKS